MADEEAATMADRLAIIILYIMLLVAAKIVMIHNDLLHKIKIC